MLKNIAIYRLAPGWSPTLNEIEAAMHALRFEPCGATQEKSTGWTEPRGANHGPLVESVAGQRILKLAIETKSVPSDVVRKKAQEEADRIEDEIGRKPGKKQMKELREDATLALLPQAFPRRSSAWVWIEPVSGWLVTDATSQGKLDDLTLALAQTFGGAVSLSPLQTAATPCDAMTQWLMDDAPASFNIERECELVSAGEDKATVKFTRHNIVIDQVRDHIIEGKLPKSIAMTWEGRVGFTLTDAMILKKLEFLEGIFSDRATSDEDGFDADVALSTGELQKLIPALIEAMGGEVGLAAMAHAWC
jgi:recombination associated protein RdgC